MQKNDDLVEFRKATMIDVEDIKSLNEKIWRAIYHSLTSEQQMEYMLKNVHSEQYIRELMDKNYQFFVATCHQKMVGYACLHTTDKKMYSLPRFYVDLDHHRTGVGEKFLGYLEETHAPEVLSVDVNRRNYKAINFYFKNGFVIDKIEDVNVGEGFEMNTFIMTKKFV